MKLPQITNDQSPRVNVKHLYFTLLCVITLVNDTQQSTDRDDEESSKVICYYGSWSHWRSYPGQLSPDSIDPYLCTHLIYSFAKIHPTTFTIVPSDPTLDLNENTWSVDGFNKFNSLKQINRHLKTQISLGGWDEGSRTFSNLVHNDTAIDLFTQSIVQFFDKYSFDGIDIDWEYPGQRDNSRSSDVERLEYFLKHLRGILSPDRYIISIAVPGSRYLANDVYPTDNIFEYVDHVHLMTYDYYGPWTYIVGHTAPLFSRSPSDSLSINDSFNYWLTRVDSDKLFLGISLYGRTFKLFNASESSPLSLADGEGVTGSITKIPGVLSYYESCTFMDDVNTRKIWDYKWSSPYAVNDDQWVSVEDEISIQAKATYIKVNDIAGAVIWSLDHDDVTGFTCNQAKDKYRKKYNKSPSKYYKPFPLTSIISETLLAPNKWKTFDTSYSSNRLPSSTTVIYVADLTAQEENCSSNCELADFSDDDGDQLNTQSNEIVVTNITFHDRALANNTPSVDLPNYIYIIILFLTFLSYI